MASSLCRINVHFGEVLFLGSPQMSLLGLIAAVLGTDCVRLAILAAKQWILAKATLALCHCRTLGSCRSGIPEVTALENSPFGTPAEESNRIGIRNVRSRTTLHPWHVYDHLKKMEQL